MTFIEQERFKDIFQLSEAGDLIELSNYLRSIDESVMMIDFYIKQRNEWKRLAWLAITGCAILSSLAIFFYCT